MSAKSICDGCGAEAPMFNNGQSWFKPSSWYERTTEDGKTILTACSRKCIQDIHDKRTAKGHESHRVVLPI